MLNRRVHVLDEHVSLVYALFQHSHPRREFIHLCIETVSIRYHCSSSNVCRGHKSWSALCGMEMFLYLTQKKGLCQPGCINQDSVLCYTDCATSVQSDTVHPLETHADVVCSRVECIRKCVHVIKKRSWLLRLQISVSSLPFLMASRCTDKNSPCWRLDAQAFPGGCFQKIRFAVKTSFSSCPSQKQTCRRMSAEMLVPGHHWFFNVLPSDWPCVPWRTFPDVWTFGLRKFQQCGSAFYSALSESGYRVACLSCGSTQSGENIEALSRPSFCVADEPCSRSAARS